MSETANNEGTSAESEKPVQDSTDNVVFPPFPDPTEEEFEEDISDAERTHYRTKFSDLNVIKSMRLHCSACDRHLGSSTRNETRMRAHPMLRTLVCHTCHTFYNSGEFEKGDDGSELYCRWCGQGGQVYCCSDCPHVFCAKCIKRNLGVAKIKEIENTDDWKCFKCNSRCLWDLRAVCWALLRYCDLKNKITYKTEDPLLKEKYQKDCATDHSDCCKHKSNRRKEKSESAKKRDEIKKENETKKAISKIPSTIQVKKFASINLEEQPKEKKGQKRPATQEKGLLIIKNPIAIAPCSKNMSPTICGPQPKKPRMPVVVNPVRFAQDRKAVAATYTRIRPKSVMPVPLPPLVPTNYNGYNNINNSFINNTYHTPYNMVASDNINLSLESLTQGLDMAVATMTTSQDDDVVCTPDFPLEPLCEVTEDNTDDDVQCITPGPVAAPKVSTPTLHRSDNSSELVTDNIIQMTDNDVTVNALTGGLKFRVDPQTLSSNKMYRLPDGRIFAIKANPNMPGGYSATIVALAETGQGKNVAPKGATYSAKLSAVSTPSKPNRANQNVRSNTKRSTPKATKANRANDTSSRECDLQVPVEWYRYNLLDAIDAMEYSLARLNKLKNEATSVYLRTRTVDEMRNMHRSLERLLNTSSTRFSEIKENLNKELKQYIMKKYGENNSEDDDDVEILMPEDNDDPIFIDENSMESTNEINCTQNQEVDLTGVGSSDHNDSAENKADNISAIENISQMSEDIDESVNKLGSLGKDSQSADDMGSPNNDGDKVSLNDADTSIGGENGSGTKEGDDIKMVEKIEDHTGTTDEGSAISSKISDAQLSENNHITAESDNGTKAQINGNTEKTEEKSDNSVVKEELLKDDEKKIGKDNDNEEKVDDPEMSEEMIETLLKDDNVDEGDSLISNKAMEVTESL
ncbi:uncharacterized protein LOC114364864 [Ostrinia furnacalis]|uniref:uncharacterized protein LOC114364864 n=1 Tax=Ostrinia furnacalis TaxID=93504 RepID=UPI00103B8980|nr:uncharacterized protein LOC114364864 [Ostrinia furnacalis]